ncbi:MAG: DUF368 domain-containing protein [Phycisphaeraceae bacterium]|nr:DUF368 domain-containing protein [Phycisphaeraceae bacterium]
MMHENDQTTRPSCTDARSSDGSGREMMEASVSAPFLIRCGMGGILMGLANLVPGISGGTMLLATGVYTRFIDAIAKVSRLRLERSSVLVLGIVVLAAVAAIGGLAGPVKTLVVEHRWVMYSLFIGLTLGGVPIVQRLLGRWTTGAVIGAALGLGFMIFLALIQATGDPSAPDRDGWTMMLLAGVAGAAAMILPGVSGAYLFLVLGVYVPILAGISELTIAARAMDTAAMSGPALSVVLPVGLGVVIGVVVVSTALRYLLARFPKPTLGVLMGMLIGAVAGLWPFQQGVEPMPGELLKGQVLVETEDVLTYEQTGRPVKPEDWPMAYFTPTSGQIAGSLGLLASGLLITTALGRLGREVPVPTSTLGHPGSG